MSSVNKARLYVELPEALKQDVATLADARGETLSNIVRIAIRDYCKKEKDKEVRIDGRS